MKKNKGKLFSLLIVLLLVIDQVIKIYIKTHMYLHESIHVTDWCYIFFTENNGMAFGMQIFGKLFLTLFRIIAVAILIWCLYKFVKANLKMGFLLCVSLILTGAVGNIIDSVLYGVIFSESTFSQIATFMPEGGGYAPLLFGKVVDMFYFPLIETEWPAWMPFVGGDHFVFFSPIFNFADSCISVGIVALLICYSKYVNHAFDVLKIKKS